MAQVFNFPKGNGHGVAGSGNAAGTPTLGLGSKGLAVKEIQARLQQLKYDLSADGIYGPDTLAAVKLFQSANGLSADGIVGVETWRSLEKQTVDPLPTRSVDFEPEPVTGSALSRDVAFQPETIVGKRVAGRPVWQWGLFIVGGLAALYMLSKWSDESGFSGYRRLVTDTEPRSKPTRASKKCARTPDEGKLDEAEELSA